VRARCGKLPGVFISKRPSTYAASRRVRSSALLRAFDLADQFGTALHKSGYHMRVSHAVLSKVKAPLPSNVC
jgi:hypothetical protein